MKRKKVSTPFYSPEGGSLAIYAKKTKQWTWHSCREDFDELHQGKNCLLFWGDWEECPRCNWGNPFPCNCKIMPKRRLKNAIGFIKKIEKILKLPIRLKAKFLPTTNDKAIYISLGKFWKSKIRKSLFTAMLRDGAKLYDRKKKNWKDVIKKGEYLRSTQFAVNKFLEGYVHCQKQLYQGHDPYFTEKFLGWVDTFRTAKYNASTKTIEGFDGCNLTR